MMGEEMEIRKCVEREVKVGTLKITPALLNCLAGVGKGSTRQLPSPDHEPKPERAAVLGVKVFLFVSDGVNWNHLLHLDLRQVIKN